MQRWLLETVFYENSVAHWLGALLVAVISFLLLGALRRLLQRKSEALTQSARLATRITASVICGVRPFFVIGVAVFLGAQLLHLGALEAVFDRAVLVIVLLQGALWASQIVTLLIERHVRAGGEDPSRLSALGLLTFLGRLLVWAIATLLILDNLGLNITALLAGLGIGGVAVALAVQNVLGDLLASLAIVLDKPFEVGDFIAIGDMLGTVEQIGIKTTRLRSLSGEQLVFSNSDLLNGRIKNYKRLYERRVLFLIRVDYRTPAAQVERIPRMIKEIIERQHPVRFDRSHLKEFGEWAYVYETVYFVGAPEYNTYMDIQERIQLALLKQFDEEGIKIAIPVQNVRLARKPEEAEQQQ